MENLVLGRDVSSFGKHLLVRSTAISEGYCLRMEWLELVHLYLYSLIERLPILLIISPSRYLHVVCHLSLVHSSSNILHLTITQGRRAVWLKLPLNYSLTLPVALDT
jgi:hypothetical protein